MAQQTDKLKFNTWFDTDYVNFEELNDNFKKLDSYPLCIESGTKNAYFTGGSDSSAKWYYKKYNDKTIEMSAKLNFTNIKCNRGEKAPYYSSDSKVEFPFEMSEVYNVQMHLASNTFGWVTNITGQSVLNSVSFRVMGMEYETTQEYKQVFVTVKGVYK